MLAGQRRVVHSFWPLVFELGITLRAKMCSHNNMSPIFAKVVEFNVRG
jgi:hypothetical protein